MDKYNKIFFEQLSDKQSAAGMTIENMRPLTLAKINGHDITLILDTGATDTFLSYEWLKEHKLEHKCRRENKKINNFWVECLVANLHICVGGLSEELDIYVRLEESWRQSSFNGCLGMDLLKDMQFTLNLVNRELSQWGILQTAFTETSITNTLSTHKYSLDDNRPRVYISDSNYNYFPILFDTGCQKSTISKNCFPRLKKDTEIEPRIEYDTLGLKYIRNTAKKMKVFIKSNLIQPSFTPFISDNNKDNILGIDVFNGFIVQYFGNYNFEVTGDTHPF